MAVYRLKAKKKPRAVPGLQGRTLDLEVRPEPASGRFRQYPQARDTQAQTRSRLRIRKASAGTQFKAGRDRLVHKQMLGMENRKHLIRHGAAHLKGASNEPATGAAMTSSRSPTVRVLHFENLVMPSLTKTCPKMVLSHKGGSLCSCARSAIQLPLIPSVRTTADARACKQGGGFDPPL